MQNEAPFPWLGAPAEPDRCNWSVWDVSNMRPAGQYAGSPEVP